VSGIDPTKDLKGDIFEEVVADTLHALDDNLYYIISEYMNTSAIRVGYHEWFWDNRNKIKEAIMNKIKIDL
jgi:hypothetical protein